MRHLITASILLLTATTAAVAEPIPALPVTSQAVTQSRLVLDRVDQAGLPGGVTLNAPTRKGLGTFDRTAPLLAQLADAASTLHALKSSPAAREGNPAMAGLVNKPAAFVATKLALGVVAVAIGEKAARSGHPTAGKWFTRIATIAGFAVAAKNMGHAR